MSTKIKTNEIDWSAVDAEFFNQNLNKIDVTQFRNRYNDWISFIYTLAQLGVDKNIAKDWCKSDPSEYDEKQFEANWKAGLNKGSNFDLEIAAKHFAKLAGIQLPCSEAKSVDQIIDQTVNLQKNSQSQAQKDINLDLLKSHLETVNPKNISVNLTKTTKDLLYWYDDKELIWCGNHFEFDPSDMRSFKDIKELSEYNVQKTDIFQFLCINPLGLNQNYQLLRSDDCVKKYKYMLLEFDDMNIETQKRFWFDLIDQGLPVKSLVYSGGKSIHCLLKLQNISSKEEYKAYFNSIAEVIDQNIGISIDKACSNPARLSRFPNGRRDDGTIQDVLYIDPSSEILTDSVTVITNYFKSLGCQNKAANTKSIQDEIKKLVSKNINGKLLANVCKELWIPNSPIEDVFQNNGKLFIKLTSNELQQVCQTQLLNLVGNYIKPLVKKLIIADKIARGEKKPEITFNDLLIPMKDITFRLSLKDNPHVYNDYRPGFITECLDRKVDEIPSEFEKLLDNLADADCKKWLINHLSCYFNLLLNEFTYENHDYILETVPVFYGKSGTGKTTLTNIIGYAISEIGCKSISINQLSDSFNEFIKAGCININEAAKSKTERKSSREALKSFTDMNVTVNEKYKGTYTTLNAAYKTICANESFYGVLDIDSFDRRFQYICGGRNLNGRDHKICDIDLLNKQKYDFVAYLLNYPYDLEMAQTVFDNAPKIEDKKQSMSAAEEAIEWICENIDGFQGQTHEKHPGEFFSARTISKWYEDFTGQKLNIAPKQLGRLLADKFGPAEFQWTKNNTIPVIDVPGGVYHLSKGERVYNKLNYTDQGLSTDIETL